MRWNWIWKVETTLNNNNNNNNNNKGMEINNNMYCNRAIMRRNWIWKVEMTLNNNNNNNKGMEINNNHTNVTEQQRQVMRYLGTVDRSGRHESPCFRSTFFQILQNGKWLSEYLIINDQGRQQLRRVQCSILFRLLKQINRYINSIDTLLHYTL
jgi:uncharacterized membrane protein